MASIHKENGGINLEGMMKYANPLSTGSYGDLQASNISENPIELNEQSVGQLNREYQDQWMEENVDEGMAPDLALSPLMSSKSLLGLFRKSPGKLVNFLTGGTQGLNELRYPGAALRGMKLQAERQYLNKLKWPIDKLKEKYIAPIKKKFSEAPTPFILEKGMQGRRLAGKDIGGKGGFKRFLHTMDAPKEMNNPKVYAAFQDIVKGRMKETSIGRIPKSYAKRHPTTGGYAGVTRDKPYVHLKTGRPDLSRRGTAVHEFTHIGQMPKWSPKKFAQSTSKLSKKETSFLEDAIFGHYDPKGIWTRGDPGWMKKYAEKMNPLLKKGRNIPADDFPKGDYDVFDEYMLRPHEISARMASMRDLDKMMSAPINLSGYFKSGLKSMLQSNLKREAPYITKKGVKYAKDKLWGAGGGGLLGYGSYNNEK